MTKLNGTTELLPSKSKVPICREKEKLNTVKKKLYFFNLQNVDRVLH